MLRETVQFASLAGAEPARDSEEQACAKLPLPPAQPLTEEPAALASSEVNPSSLKQTCGKKIKIKESEVTLKCYSKDTLVPLESKYKPDVIGRVLVEEIAEKGRANNS